MRRNVRMTTLGPSAKVLNGAIQSVRHQSSITFLNNQTLLSKTEVKQSKTSSSSNEEMCTADTQTKSATTINEDFGTEGKKELPRSNIRKLADESRATKPQKLDYSWLPKVSSTNNINQREMTTMALYSGYRPIFINNNASTEKQDGTGDIKVRANSTFYEFAMKLDEFSEPSPWMTSATGLESYKEWENVPANVMKNLKPFQLHGQVIEAFPKVTDKETLTKTKQLILVKEKDKLINRGKGRKKPILSLLKLIKQIKRE